VGTLEDFRIADVASTMCVPDLAQRWTVAMFVLGRNRERAWRPTLQRPRDREAEAGDNDVWAVNILDGQLGDA